MALSRFAAAVLLLVYIAFLYFQLITHPSYYVGGDGDEARAPGLWVLGSGFWVLGSGL